MHSRVAIFLTSLLHRILGENSNRCSKCNGKSTRSAQVPHSQIPPKQQNLWRNMRGRTRRNTKNSKIYIHKVPLTKRRVDLVENVDLDLLSIFPQKGARIIGGKGSKQAQRGQQWGEELARNGWRQRRKKTPFYSLPRIQPLDPHQPRYYRSQSGTTVAR